MREVCHNRAAHPRCDIVYLKNAEGMFLALSRTATADLKRMWRIVQTFSGCGYCKVCVHV